MTQIHKFVDRAFHVRVLTDLLIQHFGQARAPEPVAFANAA